MSVVLELKETFDPALWQVSRIDGGVASTLLLTWTVSPQPVDGGIPAAVAEPFAAALCALGTVLYAGDAAEASGAEIVPVRRGLRRHDLSLFRATSGKALLPAFDSGLHNWSMNAQWLVVADPSVPDPGDGIRQLVTHLHATWRLPAVWPAFALLLVQAAVDGDGAACHCRDGAVRHGLLAALRDFAAAAGADLLIEPARAPERAQGD